VSTKNQRLFERWLALRAERSGRKPLRDRPTKEESKYIASALTQASEEHLLLMLDWAFHGADDYANGLQGRKSFGDGPAKEYLGITTLFKDTKLDKRLDLAEQWANRPVIEPVDEERWLEDEALPALDRLVDSPESYETAYEWWAERRGRHDGGPTEDKEYIKALLRLREFRARDRS